MKTSWKNKRQELIRHLYEQNAQIMNERDELLAEIFTCQANRQLYGYYLYDIEKAIATLAEQASDLRKAIEEIDKELLEYDKKDQIFEEDIYNYYKELQEDE